MKDYKYRPGDLVDYDVEGRISRPRFWWKWTLMWCETGVVIAVDEVRSELRRKHGVHFTDPLYLVQFYEDQFDEDQAFLCSENKLRFAVNPHVD